MVTGIVGRAGSLKTERRNMTDETYPDTIFLRDMRVETVVGIWDGERKIRQIVSIDLELGADIRRAAASDSIEDTLNYTSVAKRVQQFVGDSSYQLVETMAEEIARTILAEFEVPWVQVRVNKPGAIRGAQGVGVQIRRHKE